MTNTMENFQQLLARLNSSSSETPQSTPAQSGNQYQQPSVSSPIASSTPPGPQPHHPADVLSPNTSVLNTPSNEMSGGLNAPPDLLGLLRLRQANSYSSSSPSVVTPSRGEASSSLENPQDVLLKLLGQSKPPTQVFSPRLPVSQNPSSLSIAQDPETSVPIDSLMASPPAVSDPDTSVIIEEKTITVSQPVDPAPVSTTQPKSSIFTAVDPFEQFSTASPLGKLRGATPPVKTPTPLKELVKELSKEQVKSVTPSKELGTDLPKEATKPVVKDSGSVTSGASSVAADWEDEPEGDEKLREVAPVYGLPMRPFVSIAIQKLDDSITSMPDHQVLPIAKMRKAFDQLDRTLVASTSKFIVYALAKSGVRLIRQDSGKFKPLFENADERIFNLSISRSKGTAEKNEVETLLGTGMKGSVFWAPLTNFSSPSTSTTIASPAIEEKHFIFPPVATPDEHTSSGQLKTRVKPSSKSPEFFAYGRGKNIHIIYPLLARSNSYTDVKTNICDSEKYLRDDDLKISTGKAAKDFAFSADDTVIASLDKAGKLKFWDVRSLTKPEFKSELRAGVVAEVKTPIVTLSTTPPSEKSWPTSVMFLDREKPMTKGLALRYMIVGHKQNHTIQLWDLALAKPVQEISFPHDDESDAICSLAYNPRSGILAVGHPTRNSIYLLHVSLPQYTLPLMSQAKFISMVAEKNRNLPSVNSTVIFSTIREYGLEGRGSLRSMDIMLETPVPGSSEDTNAPGSLFTLICMHSNGIMEFGVNHKIMGWKQGEKVESIDAVEVQAVVLEELEQPVQDEIRVAPEPKTSTPKTEIKDPTLKPAAEIAPKPAVEPVPAKRDHESDKIKLTSSNGATEKDKDKKQKKKKGETTAQAKIPATPGAKSVVHATPSKPGAEEYDESFTTPSRATRGIINLPADVNTNGDSFEHLEMSLMIELTRILNDQFGNLYKRMAEDKRVSDASGAAKQDAVLRLLSQTLQENFDGHVSKIISDAIKIGMKDVKESINGTVDRSITSTFANSVKSTLPREVEKVVEASLNKAFRDSSFSHNIAEAINKQTLPALNKSIATTFKDFHASLSKSIAASAVQINIDGEKRFQDQIRAFEIRHQQDSQKIDHLTTQLQALTTVLETMAIRDNEFRAEMRELLRSCEPAVASQPAQSQSQYHNRGRSGDLRAAQQAPTQSPRPVADQAQPDAEAELIMNQLRGGKFDEGFVQWLHSTRQAELFDNIFVHVGPAALDRATPLVVLSVTAAVSFSLETKIKERLDWLEYALNLLEPNHAEYEPVLPKIMDVITTRLDQVIERIPPAQRTSANPALARVLAIKHQAQTLKDLNTGSLRR